jgi:ABC-2 type transport system permease protein
VNTLRLVAREFVFDQKSFWRNWTNLIFIVGLPLLYLFIFATVFKGHGSLPGQPGVLTITMVYVALITVIGVVSATTQYLAVTLVVERETGVLKRLRSTPVRTGVFIAGHVAAAGAIALLMTVVLLTVAYFVYGVPVQSGRLVALIVSLVVAVLAFSALAFPLTVVIRDARSAAAVVLGVTLLLYFLSGNFFVVDDATTIKNIGEIFPIRHLNSIMITALNPNVTGMGFRWNDLGVIGIWGLAGLVVGLRFFRWNPSGEGS